MNPFEKFEEQLYKDPNSGCWLWCGGLNNKRDNTYGVYRGMLVHRWSYEYHKGPIGNLHVLHKCDTRLCVNPNHLFLGTNQDNVDDKMKKGRHNCGHGPMKDTSNMRRGSNNGNSNLFENQVIEIFYNKSPSRHLAKQYQVGKSTILRIKRKQIWLHILKDL